MTSTSNSHQRFGNEQLYASGQACPILAHLREDWQRLFNTDFDRQNIITATALSDPEDDKDPVKQFKSGTFVDLTQIFPGRLISGDNVYDGGRVSGAVGCEVVFRRVPRARSEGITSPFSSAPFAP